MAMLEGRMELAVGAEDGDQPVAQNADGAVRLRMPRRRMERFRLRKMLRRKPLLPDPAVQTDSGSAASSADDDTPQGNGSV